MFNTADMVMIYGVFALSLVNIVLPFVFEVAAHIRRNANR